MRKSFRIFALVTASAVVAAAQADVTLYYADAAGNPLTSLTAPAVGGTTTLSVFYTSTTEISDSEIFASFDRSTTQGSSATKLDNIVSLSSPNAASGVVLNGVTFAGGANTVAAPAGTARPYGLDILSVSATSGLLPATAGARLFTVTLNNLALAAGQSATLGFYTATAAIYTSQFFDGNANQVGVTGTSLVVSRPAAPPPPSTPEPGTIAALGLGAAALLRRRKRA